jgi:glycolate oxidase FAD binding subunit
MVKTQDRHIDSILWSQLPKERQTRIKEALPQTAACPHLWLAPKEEGELGQMVAHCSQEKWRLLPWGSGSKIGWGGGVSNADVVISSEKLNKIYDYAQADLTITVGAGMTLANLQAFLAPAGQFLPLDPLFPQQATVGGIMATADAGSWRHRYGGVRDLVLGFSFVRWDGKLAKAGSKVVKNVAGYDLMKLFTGSQGTLGFISQITFRLYPYPPASNSLMVVGSSTAIAALAQKLLSSGLCPTAVDLLSAATLAALGQVGELGLLVRFQSVVESVTAQSQSLQSWSQELGLECQLWQEAEETQIWQALSSLFAQPLEKGQILCKVGIKSSQAASVLASLPGQGQIHLGSGLGRLRLGGVDESWLEAQRSQYQQQGGFLSILAVALDRQLTLEPWGHRSQNLPLMQALKHQFDPAGCWSAGRLWL